MQSVALVVPGPLDAEEILALYQAAAATPGGLARVADEVTPAWVGGFLARSLATGVILLARHPETDELLGEIHAYPPEPRVFSHVLGDLTLAVHPASQGRGVGRQLVGRLLDTVSRERPHIRRVELVARDSNRRAIDLYRRLGFAEEGRLAGRILGVGGAYEADIPMAWHRPAA